MVCMRLLQAGGVVNMQHLKLSELITNRSSWNMLLRCCWLQLLVKCLPHFRCHSNRESILMLPAVRVVTCTRQNCGGIRQSFYRLPAYTCKADQASRDRVALEPIRSAAGHCCRLAAHFERQDIALRPTWVFVTLPQVEQASTSLRSLTLLMRDSSPMPARCV